MQWYFISAEAMSAIIAALTFNNEDMRRDAFRKLETGLHDTNAVPDDFKPELRGLPFHTPYDPRRILRDEFVTTVTIPPCEDVNRYGANLSVVVNHPADFGRCRISNMRYC